MKQISINYWIMNKTSEGDGIPAELFQVLKDNAVKELHSICQQIWKTQQMGTVKDRNGMGLTDKKMFFKRWHEYTEELNEKDLHDPNNHNGAITGLEPDILESKVRWA